MFGSKQCCTIHHILLNCSLSPKAACMLQTIRLMTNLPISLICLRTRQQLSYPASQMCSQKQQNPHTFPSALSVPKASCRQQMIRSVSKKEKREEKEETKIISSVLKALSHHQANPMPRCQGRKIHGFTPVKSIRLCLHIYY